MKTFKMQKPELKVNRFEPVKRAADRTFLRKRNKNTGKEVCR